MALTDKLTAIANAIRAKTGGSGALTLPQMAAQINTLQPPFNVTNKLTTAVDTDLTPYNGGLGYKENFRFTSSGAEAAYSTTKPLNQQSVSGFIPVTEGDLVRVFNVGEVAIYACYLVSYKSDFTYLRNCATLFDGSGYGVFGGKIPANGAYVRLSFMSYMKDSIVVTINEKICPLEA